MIEVRNTINATWVRCLVALIAELFGTWLTNAALYPQYIGVMSEARDASSLVGVVMLVALAVWALKKPSSINEATLTAGSFTL